MGGSGRFDGTGKFNSNYTRSNKVVENDDGTTHEISTLTDEGGSELLIELEGESSSSWGLIAGCLALLSVALLALVF